jgi:nitrogenase molybdenum-iron protein beta chain
MEYPADAVILVRPHCYFAVAADSKTVIGITKFLTNELGYLPDIIQITDNPPEEFRESIAKEISENIDTVVVPDIIFEADTYKIRENLKDRPFLFLLSSSLEAPTAMEDFGALHISSSFPIYNKTILVHNYAGYDGGLALFEDVIATFVGPL